MASSDQHRVEAGAGFVGVHDGDDDEDVYSYRQLYGYHRSLQSYIATLRFALNPNPKL